MAEKKSDEQKEKEKNQDRKAQESMSQKADETVEGKEEQQAGQQDEDQGKKGKEERPESEEGPEEQAGEDWTSTSNREFPVVGIGASAGGLKALEEFFKHLPEETGAAFLVVQHLAPDRESMIAKILSKSTGMVVKDAENDMQLEPNTIYTKPPNFDMAVSGRTIRLVKREKGSSLPVDRLLRSMAEELKEKAVGVILSGSGTDGTLGIKEIKGAGGMVIVQNPDEAEYDGMPESARQTGQFDLLLSVGEMGKALLRFFQHPYQHRRAEPEPEPPARDALKSILKIVHSRTGHDFSRYKKSTVNRRIERRLAVNGIDSLEHYERYLRKDPGEVDALFKDLIINVTSFFRDAEAFEHLKDNAIVPLVREMDEDDLVRVWVPGCATGEEAYSIGILFMEAMDEEQKRLKVKVFGTDINLDSIETAREGIYPENIAENVEAKRLKRFFNKKDGRYRVDTRLREMMIFSIHDINRDPPFSRVDLVSCRNLLIYMESDLQKKIMPMLHYSLKPGGYLFLGSSEGVGSLTDMFSPVDRKWKIFQVEDGDFQRQFRIQDFDFSSPDRERRKKSEREMQEREKGKRRRQDREEEPEEGEYVSRDHLKKDMRQLMEQTMLARFAPSGVIVDTHNEIQYFHGDTSSYLRPPRGEPRFDLLEMARPELRATMSAGINQTRKKKRQTTYEDISVRGNGKIVDISFIPLSSRTIEKKLLLITFHEKERKNGEEAQEVSEGGANSRMADLEQELYSTRQDLQATIEELETSNEELKSSNEELQANNEELQSTNEELDTSREELQSTNEELETVNAELQKKNEEMEAINDDIKNMFANTNIGTVILDTDLRVKRFTPPAQKLFNLIEKDIGRELADIATKLEYETLEQDAQHVLDSLEKREKEIRTRDRNWFIMRMFPYRSSDNVIQGLVINFTDATELKHKEQEAVEAKLQAEAVLQTTRQPLLVLDESLKVLSANQAFAEAFKVKKEDTEGRRIYNLGKGQWEIPELKKLLEEIIPENTEFKDYEVEHDFPHIGHKTMLVDARRIDRGEDRPYLILMGFEEKGE